MTEHQHHFQSAQGTLRGTGMGAGSVPLDACDIPTVTAQTSLQIRCCYFNILQMSEAN